MRVRRLRTVIRGSDNDQTWSHFSTMNTRCVRCITGAEVDMVTAAPPTTRPTSPLLPMILTAVFAAGASRTFPAEWDEFHRLLVSRGKTRLYNAHALKPLLHGGEEEVAAATMMSDILSNTDPMILLLCDGAATAGKLVSPQNGWRYTIEALSMSASGRRLWAHKPRCTTGQALTDVMDATFSHRNAVF